MARITFIQFDGGFETIDIEPGLSVMEGARAHGIPGIEAQCGGECSCSTCHCYVEEEWFQRLPEMDEFEETLLEYAWEPKSNSRLTCQLEVTEDLDGLRLTVPERQC